MPSIEKCTQHIIDNFPMFGFGNAEAAILQCAKELLENSFDSLQEIKHLVTTRGSVQLNIRCNFKLVSEHITSFFISQKTNH